MALLGSVWRQIRSALLRSFFQIQRQPNHRQVPAPVYRPGQKEWLSVENLALQVPSRKHIPHYVGPFEVDQMINTAAVKLWGFLWSKLNTFFFDLLNYFLSAFGFCSSSRFRQHTHTLSCCSPADFDPIHSLPPFTPKHHGPL